MNRGASIPQFRGRNLGDKSEAAIHVLIYHPLRLRSEKILVRKSVCISDTTVEPSAPAEKFGRV
jgi:hypothetical protein